MGKFKKEKPSTSGTRIVGANTKFKNTLSESSKRYLRRQSKDVYSTMAKDEGYRSRAAYKLIHVQDKYPFIKKGQTVVDLGAAPGGWSQVVADILTDKNKNIQGKIFASDILLMEEIPNVTFIKGDFTKPETLEKFAAWGYPGKADVVISDMAQNTLGMARADHLAQMQLVDLAVEFALNNLNKGGSFLTKIFQGGEEKELRDGLRKHFDKVQFIKPPSSRKDSREIFLLATGFKG